MSMFYHGKLRDDAYPYVFGVAKYEFEVRILKSKTTEPNW